MSKYYHADSLIFDYKKTLVNLKKDLKALHSLDKSGSIDRQIAENIACIESVTTTIELLSVREPEQADGNHIS